MSPTTSRFHQEISGFLFSKIKEVVTNTDCKLYAAPFDVRLLNKKKSTLDKDVYTVLQPADHTVLIYVLENDRYIGLKPYAEGQFIESKCLPGLKVEVTEIFKD